MVAWGIIKYKDNLRPSKSLAMCPPVPENLQHRYVVSEFRFGREDPTLKKPCFLALSIESRDVWLTSRGSLAVEASLDSATRCARA